MIVREKINIDIVSLDIVSLAFVCFGFLGFVGLLAAHTCADHQNKKTHYKRSTAIQPEVGR
jgi:hypothetical protein